MTNLIMNLKLANAAAQATAVTHPAPHHGDETVALAILSVIEGRVDVYRTRNPKEIEEAAASGAYIVDVGGVYDPASNRFDHHQRDFSGVREDETKYSSAGLLWKEYGADACIALTGCNLQQAQAAAEKVDEMLISGIDAADYGVRAEGQMSVSLAISVLNPNWDESADDAAFVEACQLAYLVLTRTIKSCVAQVKGRDAVEEAIRASEDGIMVLPQFIGGWIQTVLTTTEPKASNILYGVFRNLQGQWNCQAIPPSAEAPQEQRKPLPEAWRGLSDAALAEATGVEDAVFCHAGGFICGARSKKAALELAKAAVGTLRVRPCDEQAVDEEDAGIVILH